MKQLAMSTKEIKNLEIEPNPANSGIKATFEVEGHQFFADVCCLPFGIGNECMIFAVNDGKIDWSELYCNRSVSVSEDDLKECINEFVESL